MGWVKHMAGAALLSVWALAGQAATPVLQIKGEPQQGALLTGKTEPGALVRLDGEPVKVSADGDFVIGFDRDASKQAKLLVTLNNGETLSRSLAVAQREYRIQRVEGVPQRTVTPPPEALKRIREEAALVRKARAIESDRLDFLNGFEWPLRGPITGVFGSQRVYNGEPGRPHYGVDIAAPTGTQVRAPAPGRVLLVHPDMYFSGGTLIIDHGLGLSSTFIHLHKVLVEEGDEVAAGDVIAEVGSSGRATGPHLDWRMNWMGRRLDPQTVVGPMSDTGATAQRENE